MLSVIREMAEESEGATRRRPRRCWRRSCAAARRRVARTPEQLDVLREAGVVDAGGAGLLEIVRGLAAAVAGEELPPAPVEREELSSTRSTRSSRATATARRSSSRATSSTRTRSKRARAARRLAARRRRRRGAQGARPHRRAGRARSPSAPRVGVIERVEIANMHEQTVQREERLLRGGRDRARSATDVVAVVAGDGNRRLFESLGAATIVEGGQTMNPSTADLVAAIEATPAPEVILLPNNSNVILSAEQAAGLAGKPVRRSSRPTRSRPASPRWSPSSPGAARTENAADDARGCSTRS